MKNYFQSGLAIGNVTGACSACNIDTSWMFSNTSTLLWIDKIYITNHVWDLIMKNDNPDIHEHVIHQSVKLCYEMLNDAGMVKKIDDQEVTLKQSEAIFDQIDEDLDLTKIYQGIEFDKEDDHLLKIGNYSYCKPHLWTLYAALSLSYNHNASFALSDDEMDYLRRLIRIKSNAILNVGGKGSAITEALSILVPQVRIWPEYIYENKKHCEECANIHKCSDNYLSDIERNITQLLSLRNKDEIHQLCEVMDRISNEQFKKDMDTDAETLLHDVRVEALNVQTKLNNVFKKVDYWSKVVGIISGALSLGAFYSHPELVPIGGVGLFASNTTNTIKKLYEDKYKWVNFVVSSPKIV